MMDFGLAPETNIKKQPKRQAKNSVRIVAGLLIAGIIGSGLYYFVVPPNPLPADIKKQISYKVIFPSSQSAIDQSSYIYQPDKKTLNFKAVLSGTKVVFTEQPAPDSLSSGSQVYYPALGIHPYAQFQSKLGPVALANFYQAANLKPAGQSAILASQGTLLIAHADKDLTNLKWKNLFDDLVISK